VSEEEKMEVVGVEVEVGHVVMPSARKTAV